jgi:hypothetical protein
VSKINLYEGDLVNEYLNLYLITRPKPNKLEMYLNTRQLGFVNCNTRLYLKDEG